MMVESLNIVLSVYIFFSYLIHMMNSKRKTREEYHGKS